MSAPKGMRISTFQMADTETVHIYSDAQQIWLQLRRHVPTQQEIGKPSFKVAVNLTPAQAIAIARELLTASTCHRDGPIPPKAVPKSGPVSRSDASQAGSKSVSPACAAKEALANDSPSKLKPANQGKPWTGDEDKRLAEAFDAKTSILQIARTHQRGAGGIKARLVKIGKITLEDYRTWQLETTLSPAQE